MAHVPAPEESNPSNLLTISSSSGGCSDDDEDPFDDYIDDVDDDDDEDEDNSTDSLNLEDEEEECDQESLYPLRCNLSDRVVSGSLVFRIDQTPSFGSMSTTTDFGSGGGGGERSRSGTSLISVPLGGTSATLQQPHVSASASLSDTASDAMSMRATQGSVVDNDAGEGDINPAEQANYNDNDNSSQDSLENDVEAERVRRIHHSIFSSLEHDLAELVRIREETIHFLENGGVRTEGEEEEPEPPPPPPPLSSSRTNDENSSGVEDFISNDQIALRERLRYHARVPISRVPRTAPSAFENLCYFNAGGDADFNKNTIRIGGRSYTPTANYNEAPPAQPAKPFLEVGPTCCDEKAIAARKIMNKLQFGDPEDESACFVRRFWRETSTVEDPASGRAESGSTSSPLTVDIAAIAERTASLEASLEEAFDGLRLRLREMTPAENSAASQETGNQNPEPFATNDDSSHGRQEQAEEISNQNGERENDVSSPSSVSAQSANVPYYEAWDEETSSIMNNPLNYDIWDELENNRDAGPIITARINMSERRANAIRDLRRNDNISTGTSTTRGTTSVSVGVGPDAEDDDGEPDDDSTDDEDISNYHVQLQSIRNNIQRRRDGSGGGRSRFFHDIGINEEIGRELFELFTFSEDELSVPLSSINSNNNNNNNDGNHSNNQMDDDDETPAPLFPRNSREQTVGINHRQNNNVEGDVDDDVGVPCIPLIDNTSSSVHIFPNREDDCSMRVYMDDTNLDFPLVSGEYQQNPANHNEENAEEH